MINAPILQPSLPDLPRLCYTASTEYDVKF